MSPSKPTTDWSAAAAPAAARRRPWLLAVGAGVVGLVLVGAGMVFVAGSGRSADPLPALEMIGAVGQLHDPTHDPALIAQDGTYYVFSTGQLRPPDNPGGIWARRSVASLAGPWESLGEIAVPEWTMDYHIRHLWAPQVVEHDGVFHLYYAASAFGQNRSAIGLMTSTTPGDLDSWEDRGAVLTSDPRDNFNAIDPHVFEVDGDWWITFGSHWDGIMLQRLDGMDTPSGDLHHLATRPGVLHNPIEAPTIFARDGYFYLLTSWDRCCAGIDSTYRIAVGRAEDVTGPYVDRDGVPLLEGGGTILLSSHGDQVGPGGQDVLIEGEDMHLVHHYYDRSSNGTIRMQIRPIGWDDGWPVVDIEE